MVVPIHLRTKVRSILGTHRKLDWLANLDGQKALKAGGGKGESSQTRHPPDDGSVETSFMKIILIAAITLDGKIGQFNNQPSFAWTSKEDKKWFGKASRQYPTLVMGRKTFATFKKPLKHRRLIVLTSQPSLYSGLAKPGQLEFTNLSPKALTTKLEKEGVKSILLSGGSKVYSHWLNQGLVDELWLTLEPQVFGRGVPLVEAKLAPLNLKLKKLEKLSQDTLLLRYKVMSS